MKRSLVIDIIAHFLVVLFLYTGVIKLFDLHLFKEQLMSSPLLGWMAGLIAWGLPIGEILLAIALLIPPLQLKGLYASAGLMTLFTLYVIVLSFTDNHLSCSCGGIIEELTPLQHIFFNSACLTLCIIAILMKKRAAPTPRFRWFTGTTTIGLFLTIAWVIFSAFSAPATVKTGLEGRLLPSFNLVLSDSTKLNTSEIPTGKPLIVIGFSPICPHCGAETDDILKHMDKLANTRILFVSPFPTVQMRGFYRYFKMDKYPNISMGRDSADFFLTYFKAKGVPFTAVFDANKRLIKAIGSQTDAATLAKALME